MTGIRPLTILLAALACGPASGLEMAATPEVQAGASDALRPLLVPSWARPGSPAEVALGRRLFTDPALSKNRTVSCDSCHDVSAAGADGYALHPLSGAGGERARRNVPTVFNAALNPTLGWDGAYDSLEAQAAGAVESLEMMGSSWGETVARLAADDGYREAFAAAYGKPPTRDGIVAALAAFERTLITPGSRFDRYLDGDESALSPAELAGYELFGRVGCASCHQGRNVGGNLLERFGVFAPPAGSPPAGAADPGRMAVTGRPEDRHVFRVPSLRNVAVTPPYFHDGSAPTLTDAINVMAHSQLGRSLGPADVDLIVRFLGTLTGSYDGRQLTASTPAAAAPSQ